MKTLEQEFAKQIYDQVKAYGDLYPKEDLGKNKVRKQYGSMAHKLPILVRTAGLTQALAFVDSRKEPQRDLLKHIAGVVAGCEKDEFLRMSREAELQEYVYLTRRTMLALKWFKRFAQSVLEVEATDEGDDRGGS